MTSPYLLPFPFGTLGDITLSAIGLLIAIAILWRAEPALNRMSHGTCWMVRYGLLLLAAGALALGISTVTGNTPDPIDLLLAAGTALLLFRERRSIAPPTHQPNQNGAPHAQR